jgi:hypothetical protein
MASENFAAGQETTPDTRPRLNNHIMSKPNLSLEKELKQMYARTEHWISDYTFFEDEIKFLINLLDRHFIGLIMSDSAKLDAVRVIAAKLARLDKERESIAKENQETLIYITKLLKNERIYDPVEFRETYGDIEIEQAGFLRRYRAIKNEIFGMSAQLQRIEKAEQ